MRRKNLWLRLSSCTMAALIATTSVVPAAAAEVDFQDEASAEVEGTAETPEVTEAEDGEEIQEAAGDISDEISLATEENTAPAAEESEDQVEEAEFSAEDGFSDGIAEAVQAETQNGFGTANKELAAGTYEVTVALKKTDKTSASMASACINGKATLTVKEDGTASLTVPLTSITMGNITAWAKNWKVYPGELADGNATAATEETNADGNVSSITFAIVNKAADGVFVNMQSGGPRANDAYISIDYANATAKAEDAAKVDTKALEETIAKADALIETSYTKASWDGNKDAIETAKTAAKEALGKKESQEAVDAANTALTDALAKLVEAGDATELQKVVDDAKALKEEDYTYKSVNDWWKAVQEAVTDAETAVKEREAQQVLDNKLSDLNGKLNKLVRAYDLTELKKVISEAEALKEEDYTADSWKEAKLKAAIKSAQDVVTTRGSKDDVKTSVNEIETAIDKLVAVTSTVTVGRGDFQRKLTPGTYSLPIDLLNAGHIDATKEFTTLDYMNHKSMASGCFPETATLIIHKDGTATITTSLTYIHYTGLDGAADDWSIYENTQDFLDGKANSSKGARFNARIDKKGMLAGKVKPKQISFTVPDLKQNVVATHMHIEVMSTYQDACIGLDWNNVKKVSDETSDTSTVEKTYVNAPSTEVQLQNIKAGSTVKLEEDVTLTNDLVLKGGTIDLNGHTLSQADNLIRIKGDVTIVDSSADKTGIITRDRYYSNSYTTASISVEKGSLTASGLTIDGQIGNKVYGNGLDHVEGLPKVSVNLKDCKLINSLPSIMGAIDQSNVSFWGMSEGVNLSIDNCTSDKNITLTADTNDDIVIQNSELGGLSVTADKSKVSVCNVTVDSMTTLSADEMTVKNDVFKGLSLDGTGDVVLENVSSTFTSSSKSRGPLVISGSVAVTIRGGVYTNDNKRGYAIIAEGVAPLIESGYFKGQKAAVYGNYLTPEKKVLGNATEAEYEGYQTVVDGTEEEIMDPVVTVYNADGSVYKKFSSENASIIMSYVKKGQIVKLNKDFTENAEPIYRDCTLDLNGHTLTLAGGLTGINGNCHIIDSSTNKTGKFVTGSYIFTAPFSVSATLTLDDITCEASGIQQTSASNVYVLNGTKINGVTFIDSADTSGSTYIQDSTWTFPEGADGKALLAERVRSAQYTITETGERTFTVTATDLGKAMRSFEAVDASAYTKTSYAAAKKVYDEINETVDDELTADVIAQKVKELNDAIANLQAPATEASVNALKSAITAAKKLKSTDYTAASFKTYTAAITAAEKVLNGEDLSEKEVTEASKTLEAAKTKLVKMQAQTITVTVKNSKGVVSKKYGDKAFTLGAKAKGGLTYKSSNTKIATVDSKGKVTIKAAGTVKITVTAKATTTYKAATKTLTIKIAKKAATIKTKTSTKTYKYATLKKKAQVFTLGTSVNSKGTLTYKKLSGSSAITVNSKTGKLTVKKGLKKGTYKVKVQIRSAAKGNYNAGSKTVTVTVKVK